MRPLRLAVLYLVLAVMFAAAQTAVVKRNVNLRPDPSTDNDPITKLLPGAELELIDPAPNGGFYHVKVDANTGWVWGRNIQIQEESGGGGTPSTGNELFAKLKSARKPAVGQPLIENGNEVCGPTGSATDNTRKALNKNKNRTDLPNESDYVDISWDDLKGLPSDQVNDFQGAPVAVVGFLSHQVKVEGAESTNCGLTGTDEVDWHMYFTKTAAKPISEAIIVETTPRTRPAHQWTTTMLDPLVDSDTRVRISGWLMFDSEHTGEIGSHRATVWEVHPITRIQVEKNGGWTDLDTQ